MFELSMFSVEYLPSHGGLVYLRRRQAIFSTIQSFSGVVLDVGCGKGRYTSEILKRGADFYIGIDLNKQSLLEAKAAIRENAAFIRASIKQLPIQRFSIRFLFCSEVIEHVEDPNQIFDEMSQVIQHKGFLLLSMPSRSFPSFFLLKLLDKLGKLSRSQFMAEDHIREYAKWDIGNLFVSLSVLETELKQNGFNVQKKAAAWAVANPLFPRFMKPVLFTPLKHWTMAQILLQLDKLCCKISQDFGSHTILACRKSNSAGRRAVNAPP